MTKSSAVNVASCAVVTLFFLFATFFSTSVNGQAIKPELKANQTYVSEADASTHKVTLSCTGFEYDKIKVPVQFFSNGQKIFDSATKVTDFDGVTMNSPVSISLDLDYTRVAGVKDAYCSVGGASSAALATIPYISKPVLSLSPEHFKVDQAYSVICAVKVFPTTATEYNVTYYRKEGGKEKEEAKRFAVWSRPQTTEATQWVWKNETALPGGVVAAGAQPRPFYFTVTPKTKAATGKWSCSVVLPKRSKDGKDLTFNSNEFSNVNGALATSFSFVLIAATALLSSMLR